MTHIPAMHMMQLGTADRMGLAELASQAQITFSELGNKALLTGLRMQDARPTQSSFPVVVCWYLTMRSPTRGAWPAAAMHPLDASPAATCSQRCVPIMC